MKKIYNFYKKMLLFVAAILLFCISLRAQNPQHVRFDATISSPPCEGGSFPYDTTKHVTFTVNVPGGGTRTFKFLTYNLGANPALTPKQQMTYHDTCKTDMSVYGGWYQWGRKLVSHTFRCDYPASDAAHFSEIPIPRLPENVSQYIIGTLANSYMTNWLGNGANALWNSTGDINGTGPGNNNACPDGYRVPSEYEWALLGWDDGNPASAANDYKRDITSAATLAPSGLYWVQVNNGLVNHTFTAGAICGYVLYEKSVWEANQIADGGSLVDDFAPTPIMFLPAAGTRGNNGIRDVGIMGNYWSSSRSGVTAAYHMDLINTYVQPQIYGSRIIGMSVRCIAIDE